MNLFQKYSFIVLLNYRHPIFCSVVSVQKKMQDPKVGLNQANMDLQVLTKILVVKKKEEIISYAVN